MISFTHDKAQIRVIAHDGIKTNWHFSHSMSHESEAIIISRHFQVELESRIESIRKQAYEEGYKDGKHHQKKIKTFCKWMDETITGWRYP